MAKKFISYLENTICHVYIGLDMNRQSHGLTGCGYVDKSHESLKTSF